MRTTQFKVLEEVSLNNPIFIEGLPGVGHVGKLAVDHMVDELEATKFVEIYSPAFPPQVYVGENGIIEDMKNELYYYKTEDEDANDFIFLVGNCQALDTDRQYELCGSILDLVESKGARKIFTVGGFPTGQQVEGDRVLSAATDEETIEMLKEADITIRSADGGIVGASGLFLALGINQLTGLEVSTEELEQRAEETRQMILKAQQMEQEMMNRAMAQQQQSQEDLRYIG